MDWYGTGMYNVLLILATLTSVVLALNISMSQGLTLRREPPRLVGWGRGVGRCEGCHT